jgi:hypothetical protein
MTDDQEVWYIWDILKKNKDKNFVQRIITPQDYPMLKSPEGQYQTHLMASGEWDGKHHVYPTIFQQPDGTLKRFEGKSAQKEAQRTGEFISFDEEGEASWFSKNYKRVWGGWQPGFGEDIHVQLTPSR